MEEIIPKAETPKKALPLPDHDVYLMVTPKKLFLQMKKQEEDIRFVRSLRYARWNTRNFLWEISAHTHNLSMLRHYFGARLGEQEAIEPDPAGLRISEALNLTIKDIDSKRMQISIRSAKGGKDRIGLLSASMLPLLGEYYQLYAPKHYLFEGMKGDKYSARSA